MSPEPVPERYRHVSSLWPVCRQRGVLKGVRPLRPCVHSTGTTLFACRKIALLERLHRVRTTKYAHCQGRAPTLL